MELNKFWCEKGHFNIDQATYMAELVTNTNPKYVLETGFCTGRSAFSVLNSALNLKKMISIDINFDYIKQHGKRMRDLLTSKFPKFSTIEDSSRNVINKNFIMENFPLGIDWFTVDGDHSYDGCMFDMESVHNYMNTNGVMIIDDYNSDKPNGCSIPSVTKACDDFYKKYPGLKRTIWNIKGKGFCVFYY